ncbi:MAG: NADH-quinone oxidoreductase subunit M [Magnetospirillum sp. WYHS-4]
MNGLPLLSALIGLPLLGALLLVLLPADRHARGAALGLAIAELGLALAVAGGVDSHAAGFQLVEKMVWIPSLNAHYHLGIDGLSALFLPLTALLFVATTLASWTGVRTMPRLYFALLLLLEGVTMGIFCALDTLLFFLFWELTLVPVYFLVSLWGVGPHRRYAAVKYTLMMLGGGVPLLFGFLLAAFRHAEPVFDLPTLLAQPLPAEAQLAVFLLLLVGFAVKTPVFPLHTWLPTIAMEGPAAVAAVMTGLKLGAYGMIRFAIPLAPQAAQDLHWLLAGMGVVGILYGALAALAQTNLRRLLAFSSISHVGMVLLGLSTFTIQGLQGAVFQLLNFTIAAGGAFLIAGFVHHRIGSTDLAHLGGVASRMPMAATFFLLLGLAGMGVPLTSGFAAEHLILLGTLASHKGAALAALGGAILGAAYFLGFYRQAFLGPVRNVAVDDCLDLQPRELVIAVVLGLLVLAVGLYPAAVLDFTRGAAEGWMSGLGR